MGPVEVALWRTGRRPELSLVRRGTRLMVSPVACFSVILLQHLGERTSHCYFSELCFQGKPWFVGLLPKDLIRMAAGRIVLQRGT